RARGPHQVGEPGGGQHLGIEHVDPGGGQARAHRGREEISRGAGVPRDDGAGAGAAEGAQRAQHVGRADGQLDRELRGDVAVRASAHSVGAEESCHRVLLTGMGVRGGRGRCRARPARAGRAEVRCETTRWGPPARSRSSSGSGRAGYSGGMPDPVLLPRLLPSAISHHVGDRTAGRGLAAARAGRVEDLTWDPDSSTVSALVQDEDGTAHRSEVELAEYEEDSVSRRFHAPGPGGLWRPRRSGCDCTAGESCAHVAATLYRLNDLGTQAVQQSPPAEWRSVLRPLLNSTVSTSSTGSADAAGSALPRPLALRFDLEAATSGTGTSRHHRETATAAHLAAGAELWLGMRPLTRGRKGTWIKGDLSWRTFEYRMAGREY